ncbi:hypothetical protein [Paracoccus salsus]|uniref:hypothetical protein n=1 Tax=Paracoccus salsus TaxID=2911061 RepID=UPI001F28A26C|nr:hypothetical protein [Paracoccus salsus]MCF3974607.1 hypothetical protein [Paracoccus salsus]
MLDWISQNATLVTATAQIVTASVWIVYLHILVRSIQRGRKTNILITRVAGNADRAHLIVGNMGAEPIFVSGVFADIEIDGETFEAVVGDNRIQSNREDADPVLQATEGPLDRARYRDLGAMSDILRGALNFLGKSEQIDRADCMTVTVVAESSQDSMLAAGQQSFRVHRKGDKRIFLPIRTRTHQIRGRRDRRHLLDRLQRRISMEADRVAGND